MKLSAALLSSLAIALQAVYVDAASQKQCASPKTTTVYSTSAIPFPQHVTSQEKPSTTSTSASSTSSQDSTLTSSQITTKSTQENTSSASSEDPAASSTSVETTAPSTPTTLSTLTQGETTSTFSSSSATTSKLTPATTTAKPITTSSSTSSTSSSTSSSAAPTSSSLPATPPYESEPYTSFKSRYLEAHNYFRSLMQDTPALTWSDEIASLAQDSANNYQCNGILTHTGKTYKGEQLGENLAYGYSFEKAWAVRAWFNEIEYYNYNDPKFDESTGHFTQLVWSRTTEVGCGYKYCGEVYGDYIICNYYESGNWDDPDDLSYYYRLYVHEPINPATLKGFPIPN
ncbi:uncharacterized protein C5L36_0C08840 [Pichia kudriavzevii]|uniref:Cell wall protein PRY3 n=1 Tax=Pichia kudriavzevii TaxID=4909 RepID=A0A1V2LQQ5_PICKU|nr:uncharacterized protein C5L36_0C08840 [Pichia kudriavzevii]AWU76972.1 hypothetical protein C5L36_0C08840 [Pichia kudriavzevii]ONH70474.1 Cell wall protein PRY3 [Pichia kudriavzevii]ONH76191.1 Cell wall protein PRY3 [Pichia kudriavzevii]ONH76400.1 Cell wall protein PRY3 [Pichia kudriavzevii]